MILKIKQRVENRREYTDVFLIDNTGKEIKLEAVTSIGLHMDLHGSEAQLTLALPIELDIEGVFIKQDNIKIQNQ